jgi:hypothetical protein
MCVCVRVCVCNRTEQNASSTWVEETETWNLLWTFIFSSSFSINIVDSLEIRMC